MVGSCGSGTSAPSDLQDIKPGQVGCWGEQKSFMPFASFGSSSIEIIIDLGIQLVLLWIFFCELWPQKTFLQIVVLNVFFCCKFWFLKPFANCWSMKKFNCCKLLFHNFSQIYFQDHLFCILLCRIILFFIFLQLVFSFGTTFHFLQWVVSENIFSLTNLAICLFGSGSTDLQDEQAASLGIKYL